MRKISLLILAIFATVATAFAQQKGKVSFVLVDAASKQAVIGAVVEVYPTAKPENKKWQICMNTVGMNPKKPSVTKKLCNVKNGLTMNIQMKNSYCRVWI